MERSEFVQYFRRLDMALDEHERKGTQPGDAVYDVIHDQLAEDLAPYGFGKDELRDVAERCGQLSTYKRLEHVMTRQGQPQEATAIRLFNEQLRKLGGIRCLEHKDVTFIAWRDTTTSLFQRFLRPDFSHFSTFRRIKWQGQVSVGSLTSNYGYGGPRPSGFSTPEEREAFLRGCAIAEQCIKGAIEEVRNFGIHVEGDGMKTPKVSSGVQQTFNGPVIIHSQQIATDNAIQNIVQSGALGPSLKEIAALLDQSMDLTGKEKVDGLKAIEVIASETSKQEPHRNWRSVVDWGEKLMSITEKATDMAIKLGPYLPAVSSFIHEAVTKL